MRRAPPLVQTLTPAPRPLRPVLSRMALGLAAAILGGVVASHHLVLRPTPGLETVTTPMQIALDGPLPLDLAQNATLRFEGNRTSISISALPTGSPDLLRGEARHRSRNPLTFDVHRAGRSVSATAQLYVESLYNDGVLRAGPEPVQHALNVALARNVALSLSTYTVGGPQSLNLAGLRVRAMTARSDSGDLRLRLPARPGGPYAIVTRSGGVTVTATAGAVPEALRVNSQAGDLNLKLGGSVIDALNAGTQGGNVTLVLPRRVNRGSVTTTGGDVSIGVLPGSSGNLDIRTLSGKVTLRVPADLRLRVRFTDSETISQPVTAPGTPSLAPAMDVFVDCKRENFKLQSGGVPYE